MELKIETFKKIFWISFIFCIIMIFITLLINYYNKNININIKLKYFISIILSIIVLIFCVFTIIYYLPAYYQYYNKLSLEFFLIFILYLYYIIYFFSIIYETIGVIDKNGNIIKDFGISFYFSIVTFTTLGYGDYCPYGISKIFACIESLLGYITLGLFISYMFLIINKRYKIF